MFWSESSGGGGSFTTSFAYPVGSLIGQGGWVAVPDLDAPDSTGVSAVWHGNQAASINLAGSGISFASPFTLTAMLQWHLGSDDTDASMDIWAGGDSELGSAHISFYFAAGAGALDKITGITLTDSAGVPTEADDLTYAPDTPHELTLHFDGSVLTLAINATVIATLNPSSLILADSRLLIQGGVFASGGYLTVFSISVT